MRFHRNNAELYEKRTEGRTPEVATFKKLAKRETRKVRLKRNQGVLWMVS